jgi:hypothetical protein
MGAAVTATSLSPRRLPQSCCCSRQPTILIVGLSATFPGLGVGDNPLQPRAVAPWETSLPNDTEQRRGHRYSVHPSNLTVSIDYRDRRSVNYLDHSQATERANDLHAFKSFIDEQLANGGAAPTVDEVLARWEFENESDEERQESLEAIRRGFADVEAGRVVPARKAVAELRRKHNLPELS